MIRVSYDEAIEKMKKGLLSYLPEESAERFARIFADNSAEGVHSHGMNRYPRYLADMGKGICDPGVTHAERIGALGALEIYDADYGVGPLIADQMADRAVELAQKHGVACCAVRNNSHWLRAGRYALKIADAGMYGICLTNTCMNLTAWGAKEHSTGNNPIAIGIPREEGSLLLDMAVSQYAYGKLEIMAQEGEMLPTPCGYDTRGELSSDPGEIAKSSLMLPMAMWKGSALSIMLDLLAAGVSGGRTSKQIGPPEVGEAGLSQVFIAMNADAVNDAEAVAQNREETIAFLSGLKTAEGRVRAPGLGRDKIRRENLEKGIPVTEETCFITE